VTFAELRRLACNAPDDDAAIVEKLHKFAWELRGYWVVKSARVMQTKRRLAVRDLLLIHYARGGGPVTKGAIMARARITANDATEVLNVRVDSCVFFFSFFFLLSPSPKKKTVPLPPLPPPLPPIYARYIQNILSRQSVLPTLEVTSITPMEDPLFKEPIPAISTGLAARGFAFPGPPDAGQPNTELLGMVGVVERKLADALKVACRPSGFFDLI
jgi:hypothetical protein